MTEAYYTAYGHDFKICPKLEGFKPDGYRDWFDFKKKVFDLPSKEKIVVMTKGRDVMVGEVFGFDIPTEAEQKDGTKKKVFVRSLQTSEYLTIYF